MGCDIHQKAFVFSKVENNMIPIVASFDDGNSKYIPEIVGDRDYNLFGLFGNTCRSWYGELDCFEGFGDSYPEFMNGSTIQRYINDKDFHTRRWCHVDKLRKSLLEYKERLLDPKKFRDYYNSEDDFVLDAIEGKVKLEDYQKSHEEVIWSIDRTISNIDKLVEFLNDYPDLVDSSKIILVTWMDN